MISAFMFMGGLGLVVGIVLAFASKIFYVYVDPKILAVEDALPGANCGGCGLPGCSANAEAIVAGTASPNSCVAGGPELADTIAAILGVTVEAKEPDIAKLGCTYGLQEADIKYIYEGLSDCRAAALLSGGMKVCDIGCLGLGSCAEACPFDAITIGPRNLPVVDEKRCTGCGTCERVCPKHIISLSSVTRRILQEYTTDECTTPCQRACPAGIDISEYIRQIMLGDYHRSVQVIKERNPFPTVIGRICPRFCENDCRRQYVDEPVAINFLKRFVADYEKENDSRILPFKAPDTGRKIAVIGGGVEGLSAAYFAARLGHEPTVFEAKSKLGGLLRTAIARYRLSEEILDWDIDGILEMGVKVQTETISGKDFTIDSLFEQDFKAVIVASGGWDSRLTRKVDFDMEETIPDTCLLIDFIKSDPDVRKKISGLSDLVIAGGGKLALEAADICKKSGIKKVTIMLRENLEESSLNTDEIDRVAGDGINIIFNAAVCRLVGKENHLTEVEYIDLESSAKTMVPAKYLIIGSGRFPEFIFVRSETDDEETVELEDTAVKWEGIELYKDSPDSSESGILAKGDVLTDYSAAIKAINAGRKEAAAAHKLMYGIALAVPENVITPQSFVQNVDHLEEIEAIPRKIMPTCSSKDLIACEELETGFTEEMAVEEAKRCLQCGLICYKRQEYFSKRAAGSF
ncbi:MAG: electron transporter RnfB [Deltaproteobacteria bacterium]|nr:MAG: electron transporter RnfB [Deltaproteobacteria bacterium]